MFEQDQVYIRRDLHTAYGGQVQGGISTPSRHPMILLFTGESGEAYGYNDGWNSDGTFRYSGEGQLGNMRFWRGNQALRNHAMDQKDVHLFVNLGKGRVRYFGRVEYVGHELVPAVPDRMGALREAIQFRLRKLD